VPADNAAEPEVTPVLLDAVAALPVRREVRHCGAAFTTGPLDLYATCPVCGTRVKVRGFSAAPEFEDVFDAVLGWMLQPGGEAAARARLAGIAVDPD
jgi:hypothetical protein